eukprot:TRINITY_DN3912_c0_g1_i5.p3 TRINITY_DN3912_c0_g1~~TRINITY_DN3912_c0_g1_i5.p3  ORF type:complete len:135 (-),score=2.02 TRINITY_DN3912_c0_g1_i5:120-524(-)
MYGLEVVRWQIQGENLEFFLLFFTYLQFQGVVIFSWYELLEGISCERELVFCFNFDFSFPLINKQQYYIRINYLVIPQVFTQFLHLQLLFEEQQYTSQALILHQQIVLSQVFYFFSILFCTNQQYNQSDRFIAM